MKVRTAAVIATNRENCLKEFFRAWAPPPWDETIVIEDGPNRSMDVSVVGQSRVHHYAWADIEGTPEVADPTAFSRRDAAIKMYGFWVAMRLGVDVIIALDDDCLPAGPPEHFVSEHLSALAPRLRWVPSIDERPTRGLPYFDRGAIPGAVANMGLWCGVADYDAVQTLALRRAARSLDSYDPPAGNRLMHPQNYWPWCAMNIAFKREITPLMYLPKMGDGSPYSRFDDIWCGVILQRCCRHLALSLAVGEPHIRHVRASDPMINLEREAPGIRANEDFWKIIEATPLATRHSTPLACVEAVSAHLKLAGEDRTAAHNTKLADYAAAEGGRLHSWCQMFRSAGWA